MIRIGLVGLGFIGKAHLQAYEHIPNAKVVAIYTRNGNESETNPSSYTFVSSYEDMLKREDIDVVDICLPTYLHEEYITKAALAGKHIICEKPLALSSLAVKRIMQIVEKANVQLFVGQVLRFWPEYQAIKSYSDLKLGKIDLVHAKRLGQLPTWSDWFQDPEKSGGALFDLHLHDIDFLYALFGEVDAVYAVGTKNSKGAWNHIMTTLSFNNGTKAFVEASHRMPNGYPFTMSFRAQSSDDTIEFELKAGENIETVNGSQLTLYENEKCSEVTVEEGDAFQKELSYFIQCIVDKQKNTVIPLTEVYDVITILEAIEESLETGNVVLLK